MEEQRLLESLDRLNDKLKGKFTICEREKVFLFGSNKQVMLLLSKWVKN